MAFTVTYYKTVHGNMRTTVMNVIADAATQNVFPGMDKVYGVSYAPKSMNSSNIHIYTNSGCGGTAIGGVIGITGCTTGDDFTIVAWGR
jgi:hypothetical protein